MANIVYDQFWIELSTKQIDWEADTFKVALMTASYYNTIPQKGDGPYWSDISTYEIVEGGEYIRIGTDVGKNLANCAVVYTTAGTVRLTCDDITWADSTISAYAAVIVKWNTSASDSPLICCLDFGSLKMSSNGSFTVDIDYLGSTNTLIELKQATS